MPHSQGKCFLKQGVSNSVKCYGDIQLDEMRFDYWVNTMQGKFLRRVRNCNSVLQLGNESL